MAVLAEVARVSQEPPREFFDRNFPEQMAFLRDPARRKASLCPRRAGKSRGIGLWLLEPVFCEPDVTTLYVAKTRKSAKDIMWRDVLKAIDRDLRLGLKPNETELSLTNPMNGSVLQLAGADAGPDEMKKFLGRKLRRVAVDECADFRQDLEQMVFDVLWAALADHEGELAMIGTPGPLLKGLFYDITRPDRQLRRKGWSVHHWGALDNPYVRKQIQKQMDDLIADNPRVVETPWFRRNFKGEWVQESSKLCYRYDPDINDVQELPDHKFRHVLGVDLGFNDASSFTTAAFSDTHRDLYFRDFYKKSGMTISDVAERIAYYRKIYDPFAIVVDGANKQAVEEMKQRFGLPLETAEKQGKAEFIEIMNSEYMQGRIKLLQPICQPLSDEYANLIWDDKSKRREEHPGCENHGADSSLYAWRKCFHYLSQSASTYRPTEEEKVDRWADEQAERDEQAKKQAFWERM